MAKKVFVSGCYDLLHSGHVEFFRQAAEYGDLYVGIGSDATILELKHHKTMFPEEERLFMVRSIRYVKDACINRGSGMLDFLPTLDQVQPDCFVVNADGSSPDKEQLCRERGIEYIVLQRKPHEGMEARSSTSIKSSLSKGKEAEEDPAQKASEKPGASTPTRLDIAGTWIDQPFVSAIAPGWAITISLEPTFDVRDRCGLSTSTRKVVQKVWPYKLPKMDPETLARLIFCFENHPEREVGHVSGAQDAIGICVPGLCRHYYDNHFWPDAIETCDDPAVLDWLENHLVLIPLEPRRPGCAVDKGRSVTLEKVNALADAAARCWDAILARNLDSFAKAFADSFAAQIAMFPAMVDPYIHGRKDPSASVQPAIDAWSKVQGVLALKLTGAGGGGYLAFVVDDSAEFAAAHTEAINLKIRRS